jgi:Cu/Ag efflux protein CusF
MFKKVALFAFLSMFVAFFATAQSAATTQPQPGSSSNTADMSKENGFTGKITKLDTATKTITVKLDKTDQVRVFSYDDKTTYSNAKGSIVKIDDLKEGDHVAIVSDTGNLATSVKIKSETSMNSDQDKPESDNPDDNQ